MVAQAWGPRHINEAMKFVISWIEHHANIVPWQNAVAEKARTLPWRPVDNNQVSSCFNQTEKLLSPSTAGFVRPGFKCPGNRRSAHQ